MLARVFDREKRFCETCGPGTSRTPLTRRESRSKAPGIPVLVVGNKVDLPCRVPTDKIAKWARENNYGYIETSPKTGYNVDAMFEKLGLMGVNFALKSR